MEPLWLVALDTSGIQSYIFGSNRLRENIGASHLVHLATEGWLLDAPESLLPQRHNIAGGRRQDAQKIEDELLDAELLYAGGGNAVLLFREREDARGFADKLSARLLCEAPGLDAVLSSEMFSWDQPLAQAMHNVLGKLAAKKAACERSQPLMGLGVTAACQSTGLPANATVQERGEEGRRRIVSAEVKAKWEQSGPAKQRLHQTLQEDQELEFDVPDEFEDLGRTKGESSYIAVVHADGNNMRKALGEIEGRYLSQGGAVNRDYIQELRGFSDRVKAAGQNALQTLTRRIEAYQRGRQSASARSYLPFRPLVYGGDDVTFVSDGRIGLWAAHAYLEAFGQQQVPDGKGQLQPGVACAGVAIVKVRYPFARAYRLSEELCKNAKNTFKRECSALDWHLAQSGLFGSLRDIRIREYAEDWAGEVLRQSLLMRPVTIDKSPGGGWHTWPNFQFLLREFRNRERWPRNKVMALREALRDGPGAVRSFVDNYGRDLPRIETHAAEYWRSGWDGGQCVYFDAIEMIEQEAPG